jgi:8-oxo-dGTP pyrophosphatase MutT (NUDIX family)
MSADTGIKPAEPAGTTPDAPWHEPFEAMVRRARDRLSDAPEMRPDPLAPETSDAAIAGFHPDPETLAAARPAAVLLPLIRRPEGAGLLLTVRATALAKHSGQIAFPGGRIDPTDSGPTEAALREAEEEIGLPRAAATILGHLPPYVSATGYRIHPVVALLDDPLPALTLNPAEVADSFEAPLAFLMDPANHALHAREWQGRERRYYAMPWNDHYIWGVTAGIIRMLWRRLYAP